MRVPSWSVWWVWDQRSISGQVCPTQKTEALSGGPLEEKSHSLISTWACQVQPIFPLIVYLCFQAVLTLSDVIYVLYNIFKLILFFSFLLVCLIKDRKQGCVAMTTGFFAGLWDVVSCSNKEKYICKKPAEGVAVTTVPPTTAALSCEAGWNPVVNRNMCYKVRGQTELSCEIVAVHTTCTHNTFIFHSWKSFTKNQRSWGRLGKKHGTSAKPLAGIWWAYTVCRTWTTLRMLT